MWSISRTWYGLGYVDCHMFDLSFGANAALLVPDKLLPLPFCLVAHARTPLPSPPTLYTPHPPTPHSHPAHTNSPTHPHCLLYLPERVLLDHRRGRPDRGRGPVQSHPQRLLLPLQERRQRSHLRRRSLDMGPGVGRLLSLRDRLCKCVAVLMCAVLLCSGVCIVVYVCMYLGCAVVCA